jgi:hypothetical protein
VSRPYIRRLAASTFAATVLCLRQALRQQWFLVTLLPFALVLAAAWLLPAPSGDAAFRLLVSIAMGAGVFVLALGLVLTGSSSLPAEAADRTAYRSACSPGGRFTVLTARVAAYAILSALVAAAGILGTLLVYDLRSGSGDFALSSTQYRTVSTQSHRSGDLELPASVDRVFWVNERSPSLTWEFAPQSRPAGGRFQVQVLPVVASTIETEATLLCGTGDQRQTATVNLFDNRPVSVEASWLDPDKPLLVTVERLPDSNPFGFDLRRNELGGEVNGVSLLTGERAFGLNLLAAWFVVWVKLAFASSIAIFASTFLSAPVAVAFSLVLFLLANVLGFLRDFANSLGTLAYVHTHGPQAPPELTVFEKAARAFLYWFTDWYPDLSRFDSAEALVWGRAIPAGFLLLALLYYLAYSGVLWGASALVLRRREY